MGILLRVVEGWTGRLGPFTLKLNGTPVDLTGMTVELSLRTHGASQETAITGTVEADADQVANAGQVNYDPAPADLVKGRYYTRFKVTDGEGAVVYFPNGTADDLVVSR